MHEDLVKRLREEASYWCANCCYRAGDCICSAPDDRKKDCDDYTKLQAADAIEERDRHILTLQHEMMAEAESHTAIIERLSKQNKKLEEVVKTALDFIPCWIPVTERLPKTRDSILGQKSSKVVVAFLFDDGTQGTDTAHILNGIWVFEDHITVVRRTVTHWQPLPAPPKEET